MSRIVASNAMWNFIGGMSAALVAVVVPPFLTHRLSAEAYGAWALALQLGTYVNLFGFGLQIAVGRFVALAEARGDRAYLDRIVATAFWFLMAMAVFGVGLSLICAVEIRSLLPHISENLVAETQTTIVLLGISFSLILPSTALSAVFTGLQRTVVPSAIMLGCRFILVVALYAASFTHDIAILAATHMAGSAAIAFGLLFAFGSMANRPSLKLSRISKGAGKDLFHFCLSLTIWNVAMLLISGLDLIIVGRADYASTPYYAVSLTLVTFVSGTLQTLSNALVPAVAQMSHSDHRGILSLLLRSQRLLAAIAFAAASPLILSGYFILSLWVGRNYAEQACTLLALLTVATVIRNTALCYAVSAIGLGQQRRMLFTPLTEGVASIGFSLLLVQWYGATGVAAAKILGALIGVLLVIWQNVLARPIPEISRRLLLYHLVWRPSRTWLAAAVLALPLALVHIEMLRYLIGPAAIVACVGWFIALSAEDRGIILSFIRRRPSVREG